MTVGVVMRTMIRYARMLSQKNAIVCGSTRGIGRASAEELARLGARVTLLARNESALQEVAAELPGQYGQSHDFLAHDFSDSEGLGDKIAAHIAATGPTHILVNNTGGPKGGPAFEATPDAYLDAFRAHMLCNQILVQAVLPSMREAGYGRIINIISTSVVTPIKGLGVSNTIRGAVANWGRILASEVAPWGITVNNVLPGYTATGRLTELFKAKAERLGTTLEAIEEAAIGSIPAGRLGRPEEIAAAVGFLATPAAGYVNGVNLPVDGARLAVAGL
jgi:3-oxoacyl-[acyl-carrier protein] reductase